MADKDAVLIARVLAGDRNAFGDLAERYAPLVHGVVLERLRSRADAEDVVQEVFVKAYQDLPRLKEPARFGPWLARIAGNAAVDWLRRTRARHVPDDVRVALPWPGQSCLPDEEYARAETGSLVWQALDRLPMEQRRVVVLHHLEGCTERQIARFLDVAVSTVKWRLRGGRRALRLELVEALCRQASRDGVGHGRQTRNRVLAGLPLAFAFPCTFHSRFLEVGSVVGILPANSSGVPIRPRCCEPPGGDLRP
ncbi:MAG: RNA polymerase sigma factor, partial [Candidatus Latescibacterota bacterium]